MPFLTDIAVKNTVALTRERWDRWSVPAPSRGVLVAALVGELATVVFLFASGSVSPVLVRSLQLFLRF